MKIYIPLLYSEKVKRPGKNYILLNVLGEDFLVLLLSFTFVSAYPLLNAIGLLFLQISFWCVYEIGYIENDHIGDKFEDKAVLSYNYHSYEYSFQLWQPWVWALILSILGVLTLQQDITININSLGISLFETENQGLFQVSSSLLYWMAFLLILRFLFHIYNHLNKQSRVWFYLLLQGCRYCGYLVILTTNSIGLVLLISKVIIRSIQYILYRYMGGKSADWPKFFPRYFFCLLIYLFVLGTIAANERDLALIFNYQVLAVIIFCLVRGYKHFRKVLSQVVHVAQDSSNRVV